MLGAGLAAMGTAAPLEVQVRSPRGSGELLWGGAAKDGNDLAGEPSSLAG